MKSHGGLWQRITAPANLEAAMRRSARGKRDRPAVQRFLDAADAELPRLGEELLSGSYRPLPYFQFRIRDPKPRTISCADFRDRVVHHALCDVCGPLIERRFIVDSFACRVGKGTHRAVLRAETFCRRFRYCLRLDIRSFFDSIAHDTALGLLGRLFREAPVRSLWEVILRHPLPGQTPGLGLPIGNLTSQWIANLYLDGLDHLVKEQWRFRGYLRYMDDMALWSDDKDDLWWGHDRIAGWLAEHRGLRLKEAATRVMPVRDGVPMLGVRVYPNALRLQHGRYVRLQRLTRGREREFLAGHIDAETLVSSIRAASGILGAWGLKGLVHGQLDV